jgi:hypothetical protein
MYHDSKITTTAFWTDMCLLELFNFHLRAWFLEQENMFYPQTFATSTATPNPRKVKNRLRRA